MASIRGGFDWLLAVCSVDFLRIHLRYECNIDIKTPYNFARSTGPVDTPRSDASTSSSSTCEILVPGAWPVKLEQEHRSAEGAVTCPTPSDSDVVVSEATSNFNELIIHDLQYSSVVRNPIEIDTNIHHELEGYPSYKSLRELHEEASDLAITSNAHFYIDGGIVYAAPTTSINTSNNTELSHTPILPLGPLFIDAGVVLPATSAHTAIPSDDTGSVVSSSSSWVTYASFDQQNVGLARSEDKSPVGSPYSNPKKDNHSLASIFADEEEDEEWQIDIAAWLNAISPHTQTIVDEPKEQVFVDGSEIKNMQHHGNPGEPLLHANIICATEVAEGITEREVSRETNERFDDDSWLGARLSPMPQAAATPRVSTTDAQSIPVPYHSTSLDIAHAYDTAVHCARSTVHSYAIEMRILSNAHPIESDLIVDDDPLYVAYAATELQHPRPQRILHQVQYPVLEAYLPVTYTASSPVLVAEDNQHLHYAYEAVQDVAEHIEDEDIHEVMLHGYREIRNHYFDNTTNQNNPNSDFSPGGTLHCFPPQNPFLNNGISDDDSVLHPRRFRDANTALSPYIVADLQRQLWRNANDDPDFIPPYYGKDAKGDGYTRPSIPDILRPTYVYMSVADGKKVAVKSPEPAHVVDAVAVAKVARIQAMVDDLTGLETKITHMGKQMLSLNKDTKPGNYTSMALNKSAALSGNTAETFDSPAGTVSSTTLETSQVEDHKELAIANSIGCLTIAPVAPWITIPARWAVATLDPNNLDVVSAYRAVNGTKPGVEIDWSSVDVDELIEKMKDMGLVAANC